jgi:hypothetical protein
MTDYPVKVSGRFEIVIPPPDVLIAAIDRVLAELKKYRGGKIVANKHAVHKAVVALEQLCRRAPNSRQKQLLPRGITMPWFEMLWASRSAKSDDRSPRDPDNYNSRKQFVCALRDDFKAFLVQFRHVVQTGEYHEILKSDRPYATNPLFYDVHDRLEGRRQKEEPAFKWE